jgi:hypothetical protein
MGRAPRIGKIASGEIGVGCKANCARLAAWRKVEMSERWPLNACPNSIMVEVSFRAEIRGVHRVL